MPTRRELLFGAAGALVGGTAAYTGATLLDAGYGSIEWANHTDAPVRIRTEVTSNGGLFDSSGVVYESTYRIEPTNHTRGADANVVETDTYDVSVTVESDDGEHLTGPVTTTWVPADCYHQELIVNVNPDASVEFLQNRC